MNASLALRAIDAGVAAVRINPGNIGGPEKVEQVVGAARVAGIPMRIGANSGSLPKHLHELAHRDQAEAFLDAYSEAVVRVAETVGPAVVNITAIHRGTAPTRQGPVPFEQPGGGSGVLIAPDGYVLTNSHVVHGAARLEVALADGRSLPVKQVWRDQLAGIAVLRIEAASLPVALPLAAGLAPVIHSLPRCQETTRFPRSAAPATRQWSASAWRNRPRPTRRQSGS